MSRQSTAKTLLHATFTDGKTVHRWVVACFPDKATAGTFAAILKGAHAAGNADLIKQLDPNHAKNTDGKPFTPIKLSATTVPYSPHLSVGSGLDDEEPKPQS